MPVPKEASSCCTNIHLFVVLQDGVWTVLCAERGVVDPEFVGGSSIHDSAGTFGFMVRNIGAADFFGSLFWV